MSESTQNLYRRYYRDRSDSVDGTKRFHSLCRSVIQSRDRILEIGAGPSNETSRYLSASGVLDGVDISPEVFANDALASSHVYDGMTLPFADESYEVCVSNYVIEHLRDPARHFAEVHRVLKPQGSYVFRTPNLYHYVSLVSRALPHAAHKLLANRLRGLDSEAHEPWPTFYRANTKRAIERLATRAGFRTVTVSLIEPIPYYGRSSPFLFYTMLIYERLVNSSPLFEGIRANVLGVVTKTK